MEIEIIKEQTLNKMLNENYNCAQSMIYGVLLMHDRLDEYQYLIEDARCFGSGMASLKQTCGFISGATLAYSRLIEDKEDVHLKINGLNEQLVLIAGSWQCEDITKECEDKKARKNNCSQILAKLLDFLSTDINN